MIQSISDIITNSSSEVFIIESDNSEKLISFLQDVCDHFGYNIYDVMTMEIAEEDDSISWGDDVYKIKKGNLVVDSVYDNSIPSFIYRILDDLRWSKPPVIEDFNIEDITRIHLG